MPPFELLGPLASQLHQEFVRIYYLMLPVFFALSITVGWFKSPQGSPDFLDSMKRAIVATVLLVALPDISQAIIGVCDGIAERIDHLNNLDAVIRMAESKSKAYSLSPKSVLLQFNDLIIATLSFLSFLVLYVARYITIAMYHFFWIFFMITSPILLLFNLFHSTSQITVNLFRGMCEVASWKIVWAILGSMLAALSFGDAYKAEGNYLTLMVMNFMIAIAMLATPLVVRSLVGSGFQSMSSTLGPATVAAMAAAPARTIATLTTSRNVINSTQSTLRHGFERIRGKSSLTERNNNP
jgi:hypothetical protein